MISIRRLIPATAGCSQAAATTAVPSPRPRCSADTYTSVRYPKVARSVTSRAPPTMVPSGSYTPSTTLLAEAVAVCSRLRPEAQYASASKKSCIASASKSAGSSEIK